MTSPARHAEPRAETQPRDAVGDNAGMTVSATLQLVRSLRDHLARVDVDGLMALIAARPDLVTDPRPVTRHQLTPRTSDKALFAARRPLACTHDEAPESGLELPGFHVIVAGCSRVGCCRPAAAEVTLGGGRFVRS